MPLATQNPMSSTEFNTEGIKVVYLPSKHNVSNSASSLGVIRTFKAHYTQYSIERIVNAVEENPNRETIMPAWKDYTIEVAIVVTEKAVKATKLKTINSCWRKLCPDVMHDFTGFMTEPIKEIMKEIVDMAKKGGVEGFQDMDFGEIQELIDTTPEDVTEDSLRDFPGRPAVRTRCFHCHGLGSVPSRGTKILQAAWHGQKQKQKK